METLTGVSAVAPSLQHPVQIRVVAHDDPLEGIDAVSVPVTSTHPVPPLLGVDHEGLRRAGFRPTVGHALPFPGGGMPVPVAVGVGDLDALDAAGVRDAAAAFASAVPFDAHLATRVPVSEDLGPAAAAAAVVEGVLLARYRFSLRSATTEVVDVATLTLVAPAGEEAAVREGADRGRLMARVAMLSRDLATCPAGMLTATAMADLALALGPDAGLEVQVSGTEELEAMGCGGLLGVNRGSVQPPRMVRLSYVPEGGGSEGHLGLVGKGIMYDSGGINLKPSDASHSQMKNDMSGAGAVLAAMTALREIGCRSRVTAYLMCTDNMPSGSAVQLGDVLVTRNGTTVEVMNTDAEGRLVMCDALALCVEDGVDAIVDIATLTGACLRALGTEVAGVLGNSPRMVDLVRSAGEATDEPVWELPLIRRYRAQLDSTVADMTNLGGPYAGSITAGLYLEHFVDGTPWAHIDIAGTAQVETGSRWLPKGPTGFGARLLVELATGFGAGRPWAR
ncbi:leucyl aminopeptidase family protein [Ornithinimicrobium sp. LYQ92]|uniref:leucyl aminopeptidase family protein n=1 Tax=Serinicoccus sp. LYQ92 TaxID=3378798 RepID=UPI0038530141